MTLAQEEERWGASIPPGYESAVWRVYLLALYLVDMAQINLGHTVVVAGRHQLDCAIKNLLSCRSICQVIPPEGINGESVDAFIGCAMPVLSEALSVMRERGVVVVTCAGEGEESLDVYSTIHRGGLNVYTPRVESDFGHKVDDLSERLRRVANRFETVRAALQSS